MRSGRTDIFVFVTSLVMLIVLGIQVNWIIETAEAKENLFNEKANMVRSRTTQDLSNDETASKNLKEGNWEWERGKIDSLLKHYMKYYKFEIDYTYEIIRAKPLIFKNGIGSGSGENTNSLACYNKELDRLNDTNSWELKLNFPGRKNYLITQMSLPLVIACGLVFLVLVLFWKTVSALKTEKRISEHTTDFLNNMTHEFKTPLTNIALATKMIGRDSIMKQDEKIKHYSEMILAENEKLKLQVEQVLSMTALERGEIPLQKEEINFHQLIEDCVKPINLQVEDKKGELKLDLHARDFVIMGDKSHLMNVMVNLIDNAIKYSADRPRIIIETSSEGTNLVVIVSDKGKGIDKEHQKKIFDKYFRVYTGDVHDVKGFGLGLAYVKKIIELHKGTIELQSEVGKGSTFKILLPYA